MKLIITIIVLCISINVYSQSKSYQLYVEIKDTVETAYFYYEGDLFIQNGFHMTKELKKDSIGIDSVQIKRLFYIETYRRKAECEMCLSPIEMRKIYLNYEEKIYPKGCSTKYLYKNGL